MIFVKMFKQFNENIRQIYLASCLYDCIEDNNVNAIKTLLKNNFANPNIVLPDKGISPFHLIVGYPDETTAENVTKLFLRYGGDSNVRSEDNMTPVHVAAAWGRETILNLLLNCGGDVTIKDDDEKTAYDYAIAERHYSVASLLQQFNDPRISDISNDTYNITLHKVILENGCIVAEYGTDDKNTSTDYISNYLSRLPRDELNSYVENWCAKNVKSNNKFQMEIKDDYVPNNENDAMQRRDDFVTRRCKRKTFFRIEDTIDVDTINEPESAGDQQPRTLITDITQKLNDLNFEEKIEIFDRALGCKRRNFFELDSRKDFQLEEKKNDCNVNGFGLNETQNILSVSEESGLEVISSDFSIFSNSLEPLYECKFIGEIDPKNSENSEYVTCEELDSLDLHEKNIFSLDFVIDEKTTVHERASTLNQTYSVDKTEDEIELTDDRIYYASRENNESLVNVAEEYKHTDQEEGVVLIERRYLLHPRICLDDSKSSNSSSLPTTIDYDTETLRKELTLRGETFGPITSTTKRVYLKKLMRLQRNTKNNLTCSKSSYRVYSVELEKTLKSSVWTDDLTVYKKLESAVVKQFNEPDPSKKWREGTSKASFTYLLMDPRITQNLPSRAENMSMEECWNVFLSSIFYVGKGKRSRPYCHLYEAISHWNGQVERKPNGKIKHILDIWNEDKGVVCLHVFQNVIPAEAYTREAAIISALKLENLKNAKIGDFYGIAATWTQRQKKMFGVYMLHRALFIFLNEGERQLRPDDI